MLEIGQQVYHSGHGNGVVIAYNGVEANQYALEHIELIPEQLTTAVVNSFYPADRYPYVILFDDGYSDVYGEQELC